MVLLDQTPLKRVEIRMAIGGEESLHANNLANVCLEESQRHGETAMRETWGLGKTDFKCKLLERVVIWCRHLLRDKRTRWCGTGHMLRE